MNKYDNKVGVSNLNKHNIQNKQTEHTTKKKPTPPKINVTERIFFFLKSQNKGTNNTVHACRSSHLLGVASNSQPSQTRRLQPDKNDRIHW